MDDFFLVPQSPLSGVPLSKSDTALTVILKMLDTPSRKELETMYIDQHINVYSNCHNINITSYLSNLLFSGSSK